MKRKINLELLITSALAIVLTLLFSLIVFHGIFREQVMHDLETDALAFKNAHVFDNVETIHPDIYALKMESLRITVISEDGMVLFDGGHLPGWWVAIAKVKTPIRKSTG